MVKSIKISILATIILPLDECFRFIECRSGSMFWIWLNKYDFLEGYG